MSSFVIQSMVASSIEWFVNIRIARTDVPYLDVESESDLYIEKKRSWWLMSLKNMNTMMFCFWIEKHETDFHC